MATNNWTWVGGVTATNSQGFYPANCTADTNNLPRARSENKACATDACGNVWMLGGHSPNGTSLLWLSDLWQYNIYDNTFELLKGSASQVTGHYGVKGVPDPMNVPPPRSGAIAFRDTLNRFFIFSGFANYSFTNHFYNDVWMFIPDSACYSCQAITGVNQNPVPAEQIIFFPNPASDFINVSFQLTQPKNVSVELFNLYGQKIKTLFTGKSFSGKNEMKFSLKNISHGIYFIRTNIAGTNKIKKIVKL